MDLYLGLRCVGFWESFRVQTKGYGIYLGRDLSIAIMITWFRGFFDKAPFVLTLPYKNSLEAGLAFYLKNGGFSPF